MVTTATTGERIWKNPMAFELSHLLRASSEDDLILNSICTSVFILASSMGKLNAAGS